MLYRDPFTPQFRRSVADRFDRAAAQLRAQGQHDRADEYATKAALERHIADHTAHNDGADRSDGVGRGEGADCATA